MQLKYLKDTKRYAKHSSTTNTNEDDDMNKKMFSI